MIDGATLDHIAIAVERWSDCWPMYVRQLGGRWTTGGVRPGLALGRLRYANDMWFEIMAPGPVEGSDFLRRFLDRRGPGPHHLTYKVRDIRGAIDACAAAGLSPVDINLSDPVWQEFFLSPRDTFGIVIQLAESSVDEGTTPPPTDFPDDPPDAAELVHITLAVGDLDAGLHVFRDLLGGTLVDEGLEEGADWVDLTWPGPGRLRLLAPTSASSPLQSWLGDRTGRLHHLLFAVPGAEQSSEVDAEDACGVRLILQPERPGQRAD